MNDMNNSGSSDSTSDIRRQYAQVIAPTYAPAAPVFTRGTGATVWDETGKDYIDFGGGIAVLSLGHCPPPLTRALSQQAARLMHLSNLYVNAPAVAAAKLLTDNTFAERVFWCSSGAEANEAALKLARRRGAAIHAQKINVLSFSGGFHGRIGFAMAATPQAKIRDGFGALAPGFVCAPFNDLPAAEHLLDDSFCAIIVEPVQGEGGVNIAAPHFLRGLRALADKHNALLLFDEVQSGAGRTGALYAYMHCGSENDNSGSKSGGGEIIPDVLTSAKGLGGGFPVAAMLATNSAAQALGAGSHGSTYGGNALAAAAAEAVLQELLRPGFLTGVQQRARDFAARLSTLAAAGCFGGIRQSGLLIGCDMAAGRSAKDAAAAALSCGLIALTAGENTLRLAPALNISAEEINEGFARLTKALS